MNWVLILPIILPVFAMLVILSARKQKPVYSVYLNLFFSFAHLLVSSVLLAQVLEQQILVSYMGGWKAPYGIVMVADLLSSSMVLISSFISAVIAIYSLAKENHRDPGYWVAFQALLVGVTGSFLTGDIF